MSNGLFPRNFVPVNKTAVRVISKGENYHPNCEIQNPEFIGPPPMVPKCQLPNTPGFIDLTGRKKGRFTVLGYMAGEKGRWVVRCVCGTYTTRSSKSIKSVESNPNAEFDACRHCVHLAYRGGRR